MCVWSSSSLKDVQMPRKESVHADMGIKPKRKQGGKK